jgi:hypothetical protein
MSARRKMCSLRAALLHLSAEVQFAQRFGQRKFDLVPLRLLFAGWPQSIDW